MLADSGTVQTRNLINIDQIRFHVFPTLALSTTTAGSCACGLPIIRRLFSPCNSLKFTLDSCLGTLVLHDGGNYGLIEFTGLIDLHILHGILVLLLVALQIIVRVLVVVHLWLGDKLEPIALSEDLNVVA